MGLFSKFKKKLTKGLRKITPKEIAPVLPFLAMAVPGMGGIMGSNMARYLVPQLLTAAGSARTSGKINPLNQILAAGASYAAGPGSMSASSGATPDQISFADTATKTTPFPSAKPLGADFAAGMPGTTVKGPIETMGNFNPAKFRMQTGPFSGTTDSLKYAKAQVDPVKYAMDNSDAFKTFRKAPNFKSQNTFMDTINQKVTQPFGQSIRNIGSGDIDNIGFGDIMKVGSLGATAAGIDQSTLAQLEAEAEAAKNAGDAQGYREASAAVAAAIARFSDPTNQYGNNPFMANQGGRVGYKDGDLVSKIFGKAKPGYGLSKKLTIPLAGGVGLGGYGLLSLIDAVRAATGMADGGRIGYNNGSSPMGVQGLSPIMAPLRSNFEINDDGLTRELFSEMMGAQTSDNNEGIPISLLNSMAEEQAKAKRKRDRELMSYFGMNQGGRIGMNMGGGLGSIPQTPNVPQGLQLDGRGGGFIPMGAQERKDDVPAMLAKNEFVMTADAVRAAGGGSIEKGAQKMYDVMNQLESQV